MDRIRRAITGWAACVLPLVLATALDAQQVVLRKVVVADGGVGAAVAEAPPAPPTEEVVPKGIPVFHLRDKSQVAGWPQIESLEVETDYGTLSIPRDQLVRIRFARRIPGELRQQIETHVADLGNEDFEKREAATAALKAIGAPALPFLLKATKEGSEEVKSRSSSLVAEIREKSPKKDGEEEGLPQLGGVDDEVVTLRMTVKGHVPKEDFAVKTRYGDLRVAVADLTGIAFRSHGPTSTKVNVTAQNQPPTNWVDTKIDLQKAQRIKITASGQISVRNYGLVAGPAGNTDYSGHPTFGNFPMLSLVGKVGKGGQPFLVGASFTGSVKNEGRLYLGIVSFTPYPTGAAGSYQAKVQAMAGD